jgi:hypothetical protein
MPKSKRAAMKRPPPPKAGPRPPAARALLLTIGRERIPSRPGCWRCTPAEWGHDRGHHGVHRLALGAGGEETAALSSGVRRGRTGICSPADDVDDSVCRQSGVAALSPNGRSTFAMISADCVAGRDRGKGFQCFRHAS